MLRVFGIALNSPGKPFLKPMLRGQDYLAEERDNAAARGCDIESTIT
jgi:hypothetical protein